MSEQNVDLTRQAIETSNERDIEAFIAYRDPSIELHSVFAAVGGAVYHGHDGLRRWDRDLAEPWEGELHVEPEAYFDLGEHTLMFCVLHGRGKHSGAGVAMPYAVVFRWRDDLIVYFRAYIDRRDALRDQGVSEDELEPIQP